MTREGLQLLSLRPLQGQPISQRKTPQRRSKIRKAPALELIVLLQRRSKLRKAPALELIVLPQRRRIAEGSWKHASRKMMLMPSASHVLREGLQWLVLAEHLQRLKLKLKMGT